MKAVLGASLLCLAGCVGPTLGESGNASGVATRSQSPCESALQGDACSLQVKDTRSTSAEPVQIWGKESAPPGLQPAQIQASVQEYAEQLRSACWESRFDDWQRGDVECGLAVDPSGAVLPMSEGATLSGPTAAIEREGQRVSSQELASCVERQVGAWTFPRATLPTWMLVRFSFAQLQ